MSTPSNGLSLHLKLDELRNGQVPDSSGANRHATVNGNIAVVHDSTFGPCLSFDGSSSFLAVSDPFSNPAAFTIALWVQAKGLEGNPNFHALLGKQGDQWRKPGLWWINGGLHYDSYDPQGRRFSGTIADFFVDPDEWVHIAWVKDGTSYRLYRDAELIATATAPTTIYSAATDYWIGKVDTAFWRGRMAAVRVYRRALSQAEIWQVNEADRVVPFRASHPIDFELRNEHAEQVLAIADHPGGPGHDMELAISNTAGRPIVLRPLADATPSATNCHFTLRFRRGVLSAAAQALQLVGSDGWKTSAPQTFADRVDFYLLHTHSAPWPLAPGQTEVLTLRPLSAAAGGGARSTRVELLTHQIGYDGATDGDTIEETRSHLLSIVNQQGKQNIPLHVSFVGSNQVLNTGELAAPGGRNDPQLRLRITNMLRLDPAYPERSLLVFDDATDAPSRLVLSVSMEPDEQPGSMPWALGRSSELAEMNLTLSLGRGDQKDGLKIEPAAVDAWKIISQPLDTAHEWTLIAKQRLELKAGECIEIGLSGITSTLPAGLTDLALHYHDLPGYWDGRFVVPIEKSPLHFLSPGNIGIGTAQPHGLQIVLPEAKGTPSPGVRISGGKGDNASIELRNSGTGTPYIDFSQQLDVDYDARLQLVAPKRLMLAGAALGIGAEPLAALDVNGDVRVRGPELSIGFENKAHGDSGLSRALVKDSGGRLTLNYEQDFKGGVTINGPKITLAGYVGIAVEPVAALDVNGDVRVRGQELSIGFENKAHGDTGLSRALVKDSGGRLTLNYQQDFKGGVTINGPKITLSGNVGIGTSDAKDALQLSSYAIGDRYITLTTAGGNQFRTGIKLWVWKENYGFKIENDERGTAGLRITRHVDPVANPAGEVALFIGQSTGNVGIGTADPQGYRLSVNGSVRMRQLILNENYEAADENVVNVRGNTPENKPLIFAENRGRGWAFYAHSQHGRHYGNNSSIRMKKQVAPIADALHKIRQLTGVSFEWKESGIADLGFIAEDAGRVLPEAVTYEADGYASGMSYDHVIPVLVEAVKEQQLIIERLLARLDRQEL